jgi:hypothetical protein
MTYFRGQSVPHQCLATGEEGNESDKNKCIWAHEAWKKRATEGEDATLCKELTDDETKFHEYFRLSQPVLSTFYW